VTPQASTVESCVKYIIVTHSMATRRRIGVSIASTEAARRQLMHPVPCWERVWVNPTVGSSSLKVYTWIKTEKVQVSLISSRGRAKFMSKSIKQFDDEEGDMDEPLAPLPDEPEVVEGDDDEQEEARNEAIQHINKDVEMDDRPSEMPPSPKPQLTLIQSNSELDVTVSVDDGLNHDPPLNLDASMGGAGVDDDKKELELDISGLGPDGLQLGGAHDLSQLDPQDALLGGPLMDEAGDPFVVPT
jgi:hypothetical protein